MNRKNTIRIALAIAGLTAWAFLIGAWKFPALPCWFHRWTGWYCPGCGATRALHALGRGDWAAAMDYNVLTVAVLGLLVVGTVIRFLGRPRGLCLVLSTPVFWWTVAATALVFGVIRNLPFPAARWLAP